MMFNDPQMLNLFQAMGIGMFENPAGVRFPQMANSANYDDYNSSRCREEGNAFFRTGKYFQAISSYTRAYTLAEDGTNDMGLALANRSAVLLAVGFYKVNECRKFRLISYCLQNNFLTFIKHQRVCTNGLHKHVMCVCDTFFYLIKLYNKCLSIYVTGEHF